MFERANNDTAILDEWYRLFELQFSVINPFELQIIKRHLSDFHVDRFVDVGSGSGDIACALKKDSLLKVDALEPEKHFYTKTLNKFPGTDVRFLNLPLEAYNEPADCLFFRFVFQHYPDKKKLCLDAARLLKPKGIVMVVESSGIKTDPPIKSYAEISSKFVQFYKRGSSPELEAHTINSFTDTGFRLAHRESIQMPIHSKDQRNTFINMFISAGRVKALCSNQAPEIMNALRQESRCLHSERSAIDYADLLLIFEKI